MRFVMALPIGSSTYGKKNVSRRKNNERHGLPHIVSLRDRRRAADRREQPRRHELLRVRVDEMDVDALRARVARAVVHRELVVRVGHDSEEPWAFPSRSRKSRGSSRLREH